MKFIPVNCKIVLNAKHGRNFSLGAAYHIQTSLFLFNILDTERYSSLIENHDSILSFKAPRNILSRWKTTSMTTCLYDDSPFLVDEILQQNHIWLENCATPFLFGM